MREIKFRAWDKINKRMLGYERIDKLEFGKDGLEILYADNGRGYCIGDFVLMQYTGLKDKNGKEIYEDDILLPVELHDSNLHCYKNGKGIPVVIKYDSHRTFYNTPCDIGNWEVIGNIHENPELLKEGK